MIGILYRAARDRRWIRSRKRHLVMGRRRVTAPLAGNDREVALAAQLAEIRALPEALDRRV